MNQASLEVPAGAAGTDWWRDYFDAVYADTIENIRSDEIVNRDTAIACETLRQCGITHGALLDAPCGSGRLSHLLETAGFDVHGIDASATMIERARQGPETCSFEPADLRCLTDLHRYQAALNWFTSLGYTLDRRDDLQALRNLRRALVPGGVLLIETEHLAHLAETFEASYDHVVTTGKVSGERTLSQGVYQEHQRIQTAAGVVRRNLRVRIYSIEELRTLAREAGFRELDVLGVFTHDCTRLPVVGGAADASTRLLMVLQAP